MIQQNKGRDTRPHFRILAAVVMALVLVCTRLNAADAPQGTPLVFEQQALFESGQGGYHTYRIPALTVTTKGTILAFCEARKNSLLDDGDIDLVLRRSEDGGRTWGPMQIIADDGNNTWCGNPCPLVDRSTGVIWLPFCRNNKQVLLMKSEDDGKTWSKPVDITATVKDPAWSHVGTGPGHGIQLRTGRLAVPVWAQVGPSAWLSYVLYSDDHGQSWTRGQAIDHGDECELVELSDGRLYMTIRSGGRGQRGYSISADGGATWSPIRYDPRLPEPKAQIGCQGSIIRLDPGPGGKPAVLLANPARPDSRSDLTVRASYDDCQTWPVARIADNLATTYADANWDFGAYSDLAISHDGGVLLLYEASSLAGPYGMLLLTRFDTAWLTGSVAPARVVLVDEDPDVAAAFKKVSNGRGKIEWVTDDRSSGRGCLRITPNGMHEERIKGWRYRIREKPQPGEFRYVRFAWKSTAAKSCYVQFAGNGNWAATGPEGRNYHAGNKPGWLSIQIIPEVPREWTVVTIDLWKDGGEFMLTGLALGADAPALLDRLELLRSLDDDAKEKDNHAR
jgi:sialidase-1